MLDSPRKRPLVFTGGPLDRAGDLRTDSSWLANKRAEDQARILLLWRLQPLLMGAAEDEEAALRFLTVAEGERLGPPDAQEIFLGLNGDAAFFARDISALEDPLLSLQGPAHFRDARGALDVIPLEQTAILGQAKALIDWHARHRFCAVCGAPTMSVDAGYRRECPSCKASHFPRTDPATIMLVSRGDHCLLARNKRFGASHNHSVLAGFVEPGESIEECVRREVFEEVGIKVGEVRYIASQPWPFPSNMMIGCIAEALSDDIRVDGNEIVSARWFDRKTILRMLAGEPVEDVRLPRPIAIAFHLIKTWADE
jgi:NAD+ diphosphatase